MALSLAALAACGGDGRSTLPPAPGASGSVSLRDLARHPEVYADAQVTTVGTVARGHYGRTPLYVLAGGGGARIALEPGPAAAGLLGKRVRVSGLFTVTFQLGYEILIAHVAAAPGASL